MMRARARARAQAEPAEKQAKNKAYSIHIYTYIYIIKAKTKHTAFDAVCLVAVVLANFPVGRGPHAALFAIAEGPLVTAQG